MSRNIVLNGLASVGVGALLLMSFQNCGSSPSYTLGSTSAGAQSSTSCWNSTANLLTETCAAYVGINTDSPDQPLTVAGTIHTTSGGVEFPDGTTQTTAAMIATPSTTPMAFGANNAPLGTIGSSGYTQLPGGLIMQWATIQTGDDQQALWTFPTPFANGVLSVNTTNAAAISGQTSNGQVGAIPGLAAASKTSLTIVTRGTGTVGTPVWATVTVIGY